MKIRGNLTLLVVLVAAFLAACNGGTSAPPGSGDFQLSLTPASLSVARGAVATTTVTLERSGGFTGAVSVSLHNPPAGISAAPLTIPADAVSAELTLSAASSAASGPASLTVQGSSGNVSRMASLALTVGEGGGNNGGNNGSGERPIIHAFAADPATIAPGQASTLSWSVTGATGLVIDQGVGAVTGSSTAVSPAQTTEYTLTATNAAGSVSAKATVRVTADGGGGGAISTFFLPFVQMGDTIYNTEAPKVAVDAAGGVHVAHDFASASDDHPMFYGYCPGDCTEASRFTLVALGARESAFEVNLVLDPQGRPRMLWDVYQAFRYAECNANCTDASAWTLTTIPTGQDLTETSKRLLALDAQGRPRFVYTYKNSHIEAENGTFYVYCDASCTDGANWRRLRLSPYVLQRPMLALTPAGQPRLAFYDYYEVNGQDVPFVGYLECNAGCDNAAGWTETPLFALEPTVGTFAMKLDAAGRPRMVLYTGDLDAERGLAGKALYYIWCNTSCSNGDNWDGYQLGFGQDQGMDVDLALDGQNRPRLVFDGAGTGGVYAWCSADCEASGSSWQSLVFDSGGEVDKSWPVDPSTGCAFAGWTLVDYLLALDSAGNPRIGYEASHTEFCGGSVRTNYRLARYAQFNQP
ncbi:MAG: Ig domain-containing protein [Deinococcota bacterium]|nr:Ig domain-containing protein [Deinococcota bacterium]